MCKNKHTQGPTLLGRPVACHTLSILSPSYLLKVYCAQCSDYVYSDDVLDPVAEQNFSRRPGTRGAAGTSFCSWRPTSDEVTLLKKHKKRKGFAGTRESTIGLRGLVNLGNTCFMSVIVQSLIHTPLLRDYFLSDRHICPLDAKQEPTGKDDEPQQQCIVCEISRLFQVCPDRILRKFNRPNNNSVRFE